MSCIQFDRLFPLDVLLLPGNAYVFTKSALVHSEVDLGPGHAEHKFSITEIFLLNKNFALILFLFINFKNNVKKNLVQEGSKTDKRNEVADESGP